MILLTEEKLKERCTVPIYEFRCVKCSELFEKLIINTNEKVEIRCPKCKSEEFERVMSATNFNMGSGKSNPKKAHSTVKSCSPGNSCTTLELPGAGD
jgi:putative FmdB family regulatory protein